MDNKKIHADHNIEVDYGSSGTIGMVASSWISLHSGKIMCSFVIYFFLNRTKMPSM